MNVDKPKKKARAIRSLTLAMVLISSVAAIITLLEREQIDLVREKLLAEASVTNFFGDISKIRTLLFTMRDGDQRRYDYYVTGSRRTSKILVHCRKVNNSIVVDKVTVPDVNGDHKMIYPHLRSDVKEISRLSDWLSSIVDLTIAVLIIFVSRYCPMLPESVQSLLRKLFLGDDPEVFIKGIGRIYLVCAILMTLKIL